MGATSADASRSHPAVPQNTPEPDRPRRPVVQTLEHRPESIHDHGAMLTYSGNFTGAREQHLKFNLAALVVLQQTWWDRIRERWQLRRRSKRES
jgi:hypothetical protein